MRKVFFTILLFLFSANLFAQQMQQLTYYKNIEPLITTKCAPCHRPHGAGPFSLLSYSDVAKRASFIKEVVTQRYMPPWKPNNEYVHFANDRSLKQKEIDMIVKWVNNKVPEGKPVINPTVVKEPVSGTMYHRKPDLVLKMQDSFVVKGDGGERFIIFKIPFELQDSANVEAIEFFSNNNKLVNRITGGKSKR